MYSRESVFYISSCCMDYCEFREPTSSKVLTFVDVRTSFSKFLCLFDVAVVTGKGTGLSSLRSHGDEKERDGLSVSGSVNGR